jgi:hypothetical protein
VGYRIRKGNGNDTYTLVIGGSGSIKVMSWLYKDLSSNSLFLERKYLRYIDVLKSRGLLNEEAS